MFQPLSIAYTTRSRARTTYIHMSFVHFLVLVPQIVEFVIPKQPKALADLVRVTKAILRFVIRGGKSRCAMARRLFATGFRGSRAEDELRHVHGPVIVEN